MKSELEKIPGVGPKMALHFKRLGCSTLESLKTADPEELYQRECRLFGRQDPCVLYVYRLAVQYAKYGPEAVAGEKSNWWYWKDHTR